MRFSVSRQRAAMATRSRPSNRALSILRGAINWGRFQDTSVLSTSSFHRFGVSIKTKKETKRDRRIGLQEEQRLPIVLPAKGHGHGVVGDGNEADLSNRFATTSHEFLFERISSLLGSPAACPPPRR